MFTTGHLIRIVKETENSGTSFTGKSSQWIFTLLIVTIQKLGISMSFI